nr:Arc family DNA-binding protein [Yersinia intermedia]
MARDEPKVNIRLPQELKDQLHELAAKNKRSVNAEVVAAIESAIYTARSIEGITDEQHSTIDRIIAAESRNDTKGADKNYKLLKKSKRS